jgi:uncharacterized protein YndB with AHSA1/START domain
MARFEQTATVNVPPQKAFEYLADITKHPEWANHQLEIEKVSEGPVAVGSEYRCVGHQMGEHHAKVVVTELVPSQKIVYEAEDDTGHYRHFITVTAKDGAAEITKGSESLSTPLKTKLLAPILPFVVPGLLKGDLQRIKERLEGEGENPEPRT